MDLGDFSSAKTRDVSVRTCGMKKEKFQCMKTWDQKVAGFCYQEKEEQQRPG